MPKVKDKVKSRSTKYRHSVIMKANIEALDFSSSSDEEYHCVGQEVLPEFQYQPDIHDHETEPFGLRDDEVNGSRPRHNTPCSVPHEGNSNVGVFQEHLVEPHFEEVENPPDFIAPTKMEEADIVHPNFGNTHTNFDEEMHSNVDANSSSSEDLDEPEAFDDEWVDALSQHQLEQESENSSTNSEEEEDADKPPGTDRSLFAGSKLLLVDSILALLTLSYRFSLTGECLTAILDLILLHCPKPNICLKSLYSLKKIFSSINARLEFHYYCTNCKCLLKRKDTACTNCPTIAFKLGYFIEMSVLDQLESLFKRKSFYTDLQYRFHRKKQNEQGIGDIYDGDVYKQQFENNGFLSDPHNISFMWYTDGVPLFKSSKFSIWPLYYSINELPYTKRTLTENMIVGGLWFGESKPDGNTFLRPLYNSLLTLYNGIQVSVPGSDSKITIKSRLLCGTCDLPAKCLVMNTMQFNGAYGCPRCLQKGERHALGPRSGVHVYPYQEDVELRTHDGTVRHGAEATTTGTAVYGVKGPSMLSLLVPDMIRSTAVDIMHSLYLGITKRLLHLWFDASFSKFPFSLSLMLNVIDKRLTTIKPPNFVPRTPRSIREHLCYWKASELKAWLFYYSIPVLYGIMEADYLHHHIQLVLAMYILNQRSISEDQLEFCVILIKTYVKNFQDLYGLRFMSANVHQLLHYVETVRDLGPLWVSSCFPFEDLNGRITRLVHGTRYAQLQICSSISYIQNLPHLINSLNNNSEVQIFCNKLNAKKSCKINEQISDNVFSIGSYKHLLPVPLAVAEALYNANIMVGSGNCQMFYRLKKHTVLYCSMSYTNIKKTASFCVLFGANRDVALIRCFVRWSNCNCKCLCKCVAQFYAVLDLYECTDIAEECNYEHYNVFFLKKMSPKHELLAVPVEELICLCFSIEINNEYFWALPVNNIEAE